MSDQEYDDLSYPSAREQPYGMGGWLLFFQFQFIATAIWGGARAAHDAAYGAPDEAISEAVFVILLLFAIYGAAAGRRWFPRFFGIVGLIYLALGILLMAVPVPSTNPAVIAWAQESGRPTPKQSWVPGMFDAIWGFVWLLYALKSKRLRNTYGRNAL
jgi:hypothetical protein